MDLELQLLQEQGHRNIIFLFYRVFRVWLQTRNYTSVIINLRYRWQLHFK